MNIIDLTQLSDEMLLLGYKRALGMNVLTPGRNAQAAKQEIIKEYQNEIARRLDQLTESEDMPGIIAFGALCENYFPAANLPIRKTVTPSPTWGKLFNFFSRVKNTDTDGLPE